jgi:SPP1 gp7 family putative phage head morphogenesis protein
MCELCVNTEKHLSIYSYRYDPTHTTTLRNRFAGTSNRYFNYLINAIRSSVGTHNIFGFGTTVDAEQIRSFNLWLDNQFNSYIFSNWFDKYVEEAYKKGLIRARNELIKAGYPVQKIDDINALLRSPQHLKMLNYLKESIVNELRGITDALKQQLNRVLSGSILAGENNKLIAKKLIAVINGKNAKQLGVTNTLGRFIPAKRRAELMARTETVRIHHLANIEEYSNAGVSGVRVMAEWVTAKDEKVCNICIEMEGKIFTLEKIAILIPVHVQCRCIALPIKVKKITNNK